MSNDIYELYGKSVASDDVNWQKIVSKCVHFCKECV